MGSFWGQAAQARPGPGLRFWVWTFGAKLPRPGPGLRFRAWTFGAELPRPGQAQVWGLGFEPLGPSCPGQARPRPSPGQARPGRKISPSTSFLKYSIPAIQNFDFLRGRRVERFCITLHSFSGSAAVHDPAYSKIMLRTIMKTMVFSKKQGFGAKDEWKTILLIFVPSSCGFVFVKNE